MPSILVIYFNRSFYPLRKTSEEHLNCFKKHFRGTVHYVNAAFKVPKNIFKVPYDLIIVHTSFLATLRWWDEPYETWVKHYCFLNKINAPKVILPQDEFFKCDRICRFINDFNIDGVFSVSPETEWDKIYPGIDRKKIRFEKILTGYLESETISEIDRLSSNITTRDIDISYRAWKAEYWLGRHGLLKKTIAESFQLEAQKFGLRIDISTNDRDTLLGLDWYKFLLRSKYVIGVEGGASLLDFDGKVREKVTSYLEKFPNATFEETEKACFIGKDGNLKLFAISPRHFEACLTKTCQILIEGEYNGLLQPWKHYIPLKKDYSNINEVLEIVKKDELRKEIVENAYRDIVKGGQISYDKLVSFITKDYIKEKPSKYISSNFQNFEIYLHEKIAWLFLCFTCNLKKILPRSLFLKIKKVAVLVFKL